MAVRGRKPDRPYASGVPGVQDEIATALSEITATLVETRDSGTILWTVSQVGERLLGAAATGLLMVDPRGGVSVVYASEERARLVELLQSLTGDGPCVEAIRAGVVVGSRDLAEEPDRWPVVGGAALEAGYRAIHAMPMRLGERVVGGFNLLYTRATDWLPWHEHLGRVLADLSVLGLSAEDGPRRAAKLAQSTLAAMNDRVELAQATGFVAGALDLGTEEAAVLIAHYTRTNGATFRDVARALTDGALEPGDLTAAD
jgi:GAF domain